MISIRHTNLGNLDNGTLVLITNYFIWKIVDIIDLALDYIYLGTQYMP